MIFIEISFKVWKGFSYVQVYLLLLSMQSMEYLDMPVAVSLILNSQV